MHRFLVLTVLALVAPALTQDRVLVTSFRVTPDLSGLGQEAADILATSLPAGNMAIPKTLLSQELALRQWREPLATEQLVALARTLGARAFVRGALLVTFPRARVRTARIELAMELVDGSDQSVVGGMAEAMSVPRIPADPAQQAEKIGHAAREMVTRLALKLSRTPLATGKVLVASGNDLHINIGQRQGLRRGTRLMITRPAPAGSPSGPAVIRVGEAVVQSCTELSAIARPISREVVAESLDTVTQVLELPASRELLGLLRS